MRHPPIDPISFIALAIAGFSMAQAWLRRRRQRAHLGRPLRSIADVGSERGDR